MANISTSEFRSGLKIIIDRDPCVIVENEFVKPGKGQAFSRVRIRNLKTGKTVDKTFKSGESVEPGAPPAISRWWPEVPWRTAEQDPIVSTGLASIAVTP